MQVLPGKHAAEMPMVGPIGHCKAAVGLFPRQHASCPPRSQCPQGCWEWGPGPWRTCLEHMATRSVLWLLRNRINGMSIYCKSGFARLVYTSGLGGPEIAICMWERLRTW